MDRSYLDLSIPHLPHDWCGPTWAPQGCVHGSSMGASAREHDPYIFYKGIVSLGCFHFDCIPIKNKG